MEKMSIEQEIHQIRSKLYEEYKNMTPQEHTRIVNEKGRKLAEEFGFVIMPQVRVSAQGNPQ